LLRNSHTYFRTVTQYRDQSVIFIRRTLVEGVVFGQSKMAASRSADVLKK